MRQPAFERWGNAVMNCNYRPFKRVTGEKERSRITLPCGRSLCSRCKAMCAGRPTMGFAMSPAV